MGCLNSKSAKDVQFTVPPGEDGGSPTGANGPANGGAEPLGRLLLPASKTPPTLEEARNSDEARAPRLSVKYTAKELSGRGSSGRRSSTPFDRARIGTHTRHGLMPGPRGFSAAKINQDRGVVCWPFNGSYNQALLCIFDGHGSKGERASEFCMKTVPELLELEGPKLRADPPGTHPRPAYPRPRAHGRGRRRERWGGGGGLGAGLPRCAPRNARGQAALRSQPRAHTVVRRHAGAAAHAGTCHAVNVSR
jgi:hypothetical protein